MKRIVIATMILLLVSLLGHAQAQESDMTLNEALALARKGVSHNSDWIPFVQEFDAIPMVLVPAGCFTMGSTDEQIAYLQSLGAGDWFSNQQPASRYCFEKPFWIDQTELKQADFERLNGKKNNPTRYVGKDLPVEEITWYEANTFCLKRGMRLPTEAEWEYAARGPDSLIFPWGNEFIGTSLNYCDEHCIFLWFDASVNDGYRYTAPVGSYPAGASWVNALDMSGNVGELTHTLYRDYPYDPNDGREDNGPRDPLKDSIIVRGGSWRADRVSTYAAGRGMDIPGDFLGETGFRCAGDVVDMPQ